MSFSDAGHRPHADHKGEEPRTPITRGPESICVTLDTWGPRENLFPAMYDALMANWGEAPSESVYQSCREGNKEHHAGLFESAWEHLTGWCRLSDAQRAYVEKAFAGQTLPQILEGIQFHFRIDGVTRAETHQLVRTRIGAAFMQHGGRDNDWRQRAFSIPETVARAIEMDGMTRKTRPDFPKASFGYPSPGAKGCVTDWGPIESLVIDSDGRANNLMEVIDQYLDRGKRLYSALVDAGIPWQDARRFLWTGTQTYIHGTYTYASLKGVLGNRLEHTMDWEINCVAQLMQREVNRLCPPLFGKYLGSVSDKAGKALFAGMESWPPDGKHPVTGVDMDLPRAHTNEQMPFFVLHPDALAGGEVKWIPTNGVYPHDVINAAKEK